MITKLHGPMGGAVLLAPGVEWKALPLIIWLRDRDTYHCKLRVAC